MIKLWTLKDRENRGRTLREEDNILLWFVIFGESLLRNNCINVWIFWGNSYIFSREVPGTLGIYIHLGYPSTKFHWISSKAQIFILFSTLGNLLEKWAFSKLQNYQHYFFVLGIYKQEAVFVCFQMSILKTPLTEPDFLTLEFFVCDDFLDLPKVVA